MRRVSLLTVLLVLVLTVTATTAYAQDDGELAPPEIPSEAVYIAFPVEIKLDGNLSDWKGVPTVTVDKGPSTSPDPAENGSFTFAVAANADNLFVTMSMPDKNIVAGQHDQEYWNEDSFEFYVNASGNLGATAYEEKIFQINVNATNIGNTDPAMLSTTGVFSTDIDVTGLAFKTADGWGIEVAVPLEGLLEPEHGLEIGFQAQINGATEKDRDVKLIWSEADTGDTSWSNPSVFGRGLFFEVGQTDIPMPSEVEAATATPETTPTPIPTTRVYANQVGYLPNAAKRATVVSPSTEPIAWDLVDAADAVVLSGLTTVFGDDDASGDYVHIADFSSFTTEGTGYVLKVDDAASYPFDIGLDIYEQLKVDALAYFYQTRSGIEIAMPYAGDEQWAHPAGHIGVEPNQGDTEVTCFEGTDSRGQEWPGCDYTLDVSGGWYDAGDHGKYVVNGGISVWTMMNQYERAAHLGSSADDFADGKLNIPENSNDVPDILDEARWQMEFMLKMQIPTSTGDPMAGMAHHKVHDVAWTGLGTSPDQDPQPRFLYPPTTAATLNLAASAAQCARVWKDIDADFSQRCLDAATLAWTAAQDHPKVYASDFNGGGSYGDDNVTDEFYWAAAELYITTGEPEYKDYLTASDHYQEMVISGGSSMGWLATAALGNISLAVVPNELGDAEVETIRGNIMAAADDYLDMIDQGGYRVPFVADSYPWGSNSSVLNNMIIMALAFDLSDNQAYLQGVSEGMDYLLGRNALGQSYITGYGEVPTQNPHHRFWARQLNPSFPPPPPGIVAGGPSSGLEDPYAQERLAGCAQQKCYVDHIESYSTNEITINWNAPLAWTAAFLDEQGSAMIALPAVPTSTPQAVPTDEPQPTSEPTPEPGTGTPMSPAIWIALIAVLIGAGVAIWLARRGRGSNPPVG